MIFELGKEIAFPPPAYAEPDGLLAIGGDLNIDRLLTAYSSGIFPWFNPDDPILWWSPDPRPIFIPGQIRVTKSLRKTINKNTFKITIDKAFKDVLEGCAKTPRRGETATWLTEEMKEAYTHLHLHGYAHSVEAWQNNELVGGLYGISLGKAFFGESMFHSVTNASKVAFYYLSEFLAQQKFHFIDGQVTNPHLLSLGAIEVSREEYLLRLHKAMKFSTEREIWKEGIRF